MVLRVPIAFALGLACLPILIIEPRLSPLVLFNQTFKSYNSFILLAVPFFLLTANLMNVGGITDRLVRLSRDLVGHLPGGLAQVNVVLSIFFAGISGSSTADAASQGKIFIEAQVKEGYDLSFSVAITAVSAVLAVIIPPSILMIVWGGTLTVSIGALFLAGIIPGLLLGLVQMATVHVYAKLRNYPEVPALEPEGSAHRDGGRDSGADDAGDHHRRQDLRLVHRDRIGVHRGALRGRRCRIFVYREMSGKALHGALLDTGKLAAVALFCVGTASAFGWLLAYYQIPKALLAGVGSWGMGVTGDRLLHRVLLPGRRLLPRRDPGDHHRRHHPRAAGPLGEHGPRALRDDRHRLARLRAGDAALRLVPHDQLRDRQGANDVRAEGRHDHADADARRAGGDDRVSGDHPVPAEAHLAGVPEVTLTLPRSGESLVRAG